ncbi:Xylulose kinase [Propionicimonas sp. T2.31MG-18]
MPVLVAGVDTSTQSCKVVLRDLETFEVVASGSAPHPVVTPPLSEQEPQVWWSAFLTSFGSALAAAPAGSTVAAISVAGQCHGLVALDAGGRVIRPAKLWNDTTTSAELEALRERIGDGRFIARTGSLPTAAFTISKVAWLARHEPNNFRRLRTMLLPHDYLTYRLTGHFVTDRSEASGTGYFDAAANEYVFDFLREIDPAVSWEDMVPKVLGPEGVAGTVQPEVAAELGIAADVLVGAGAGDQHASAVGLGLRDGELTVALGTSGVVFTPTPLPVRDPSGLINGVASVTPGFLPLACTLNAAKVTDTFARLLGVDHAELTRLALAAEGDDGPTLVAYLDGERTPDRPGASGLLAHISTEATREQVARAAYEGVVFGLAYGVERLTRCGVDTGGSVFAVGGGARSAAYTQFLADVLDRPVLAADAEEATARGAAVQALAVVTGRTVAEVAERWRPPSRTVAEPRGFSRTRWDRYLAACAVTELDRPAGGR